MTRAPAMPGPGAAPPVGAPPRRRWAAAAALATVGAAALAEGWIAQRLLADPTAFADLLAAQAGVALATGLCAALLYRLGERDPLFLLFAVAVAFLGPVGVVGAAVAALFRLAFARRATPFLAWYASLFPTEEPDPTRALHESVVLRGRGPAKRSTVAPFADVMALGSLREKQSVLALIAERFRPPFAGALRAALNDAEPVVRVQAAAAVARIENGYLQRAMSLEERHAERPDDPELMLALARHYDEHAATGLLDEGRTRESAERALGLYLQLADRVRGGGVAEAAEAIGRLLLQLGRVEQAARVLRLMVADGAGGGPPPHGALGHYLECLYRLRRFAELREVCRRFAQDLEDPAVPDEIREAARLWAQGGEVRVREDATA
jgi:hypothetical protein